MVSKPSVIARSPGLRSNLIKMNPLYEIATDASRPRNDTGVDEFSLSGSILGIDEAGRGPVIGPMVVCGFSVDHPSGLDRLKIIGVKDSKALKPAQRERIFEQLQEFHYHIEMLSPAQIDVENITELELQAVGKIYSRFSPHTIIFDAPTHPVGIPALTARVRNIIRKSKGNTVPRLVLENKADTKYLTCMAASIVAKVTRDREIAKLRAQFGNFGSGYPSDPKTKAFIAQLAGGSQNNFLIHVRKKWSTWRVAANGGPGLDSGLRWNDEQTIQK